MADAGGDGGDNPNSKRSEAAASPLKSPVSGSLQDPDAGQRLLDRLKAWFEDKGGEWQPGWQVDIKQRTGGKTSGTSDTYYISPAGKRFRSRAEIARAFGLAEDPRGSGGGGKKSGGSGRGGARTPGGGRPEPALSRDESYALARSKLADAQLPVEAGRGVRVVRLGSMAAGFHDSRNLWPLGYLAEWRDEGRGLLFRSSVQEGSGAPVFRVTCLKEDAPGGDSAGGPAARAESSLAVQVENSHEAQAVQGSAGAVSSHREQGISGGGVGSSAAEKRAVHAAHTELLLGSGDSPEEAWEAAASRQQEALDVALAAHRPKSHHKTSDPAQQAEHGVDAGASAGTAGGPAGAASRVLDDVDELLIACRPLAGMWGRERFGLACVDVLQAIEGLPGSELCQRYEFVDQRGGWAVEGARLAALLAQRSKLAAKAARAVEKKEVQLGRALQKRKPGGGKGGPLSQKKAKTAGGPPAGAAGKDDIAVAKVVEHMLRQLEGNEAKRAAAAARAEAKAQRGAQRHGEKQARRELKHRELEAAKAAQRKGQHAKQGSAAGAAGHTVACPRQPSDAIVDDALLPGSSRPPPPPDALASPQLPPQCHAALLEAWHLGHRFRELLDLDPVPTLDQIEASLLTPLTPRGAPGLRLQMSLLEFLLGDVFENVVEGLAGANQDVREADLKPHPRSRHPLPLSRATFPEASRRLLLLLASAGAQQGREGGTAGSAQLLASPDPNLALEYLTAGPPARLESGPAILPKGASSTAAESLLYVQGALAVAAAEKLVFNRAQQAQQGEVPAAQLLPGRGLEDAGSAGEGHAGGGECSRAGWEGSRQETTLLLRCLLYQVANVKGERGKHGRTLCFDGGAAAAAAKAARPHDLRQVAALVDAGYYSSLAHPLEAFKADVAAVCALFQAGCQKHSSDFAAEMRDKAAPEVAALAASRLDSALAELAQLGTAGWLAQHAPQQAQQGGGPHQSGRGAGGGGDGEDATEGGGGGDAQDLGDPVRDLGRPFTPYEGCVVCWSDEDRARILLCDCCDVEFHTYCMEPPLEEIPQGAWFCPRCHSQMQQEGPPRLPWQVASVAQHGRPRFGRASSGEAAWKLAQRLGTVEYSEWTVEERCELLCMLCALVSESHALHDHLYDQEEEVKEIRREILLIRLELKRQREQRSAATSAKPGHESKAGSHERPPSRATRGRDARDEETQVKRLSRLEHTVHQVPPVRLEPVGCDRHWSRYWAVPAAALAPPSDAGEHRGEGEPPPVLCVERCHHQPHPLAPAADVAAPNAAGPAGTLPASEEVPQAGGRAAAQQLEVGVYRTPAQLEQLLRWLNPIGPREKLLATRVKHLLAQHERWAQQQQQLGKHAGGGSGQEDENDADAAAAGTTAGGGGANVAMQAAEGDGSPADVVEMSVEAAPAPGGEHVSPAAALLDEMLEFQEGIPEAALDSLLGSDSRMESWRAAAAAAALSPPFGANADSQGVRGGGSAAAEALMGLLLVLEGGVKAEWLKPHWRPWSVPAPLPPAAGTLAAVRLRYEAFKSAVRTKPPPRSGVHRGELAALVAGGGGGGHPRGGVGAGYLFRDRPRRGEQAREEERRNKRPWWEVASGTDSEEGSCADRAAKRAQQRRGAAAGTGERGAGRADRAAKRAKHGAQEDDDAEVARQMHAELNAGGRLTRSRLRHVSTHSSDEEQGGEGGYR